MKEQSDDRYTHDSPEDLVRNGDRSWIYVCQTVWCEDIYIYIYSVSA